MSLHAIDFGTSNSLLSFVPKDGDYALVPMEKNGEEILKSLIFTPEENRWYFGQEAIDEYQEQVGEGRFFKSIKKFLPEPSYNGTNVHEKKMQIEEIIAAFLRTMRDRANEKTGVDVENVLLGRPALYSLKKENDTLAQNRMEKAAKLAGYKYVEFCPEPLAAGLDFEKEDREKIVLICDFGGGTSDFTLLKIHDGKYTEEDVLGLSGIFLAGDALDGVMMYHSISPHFGKNVTYSLPMSDNVIKFPRWLLSKMCSPAHITHLKEKETWDFLNEVKTWSLDETSKRHLDQLFILVEHQLGYPIFSQIEKSKIEMSFQKESLFEYKYPGINIKEQLMQLEFLENAHETVDKILTTMQEVFKQSGLSVDDVDTICLTGGTAQSPLLRQPLGEIFGKEKLKEHKVYQSVVGGLSKYAQLHF